MNTHSIINNGNNRDGWTGTGTRNDSTILSPEDSALYEPVLPTIRCFRCGERYPVTDFLRTKKSGLCESCWKPKRSTPNITIKENVQNHVYSYSVYENLSHQVKPE